MLTKSLRGDTALTTPQSQPTEAACQASALYRAVRSQSRLVGGPRSVTVLMAATEDEHRAPRICGWGELTVRQKKAKGCQETPEARRERGRMSPRTFRESKVPRREQGPGARGDVCLRFSARDLAALRHSLPGHCPWPRAGAALVPLPLGGQEKMLGDRVSLRLPRLSKAAGNLGQRQPPGNLSWGKG